MNQFGFQKTSRTLSAATICFKINKISPAIFIDFRKAFETVPHILFCEKTQKYELRGNINDLLHDYLKSRSQFVVLNDNSSNTETNDNPFAMPQGNYLGPLLFLSYINGIFDLKLNGVLKHKMQADLITIGNWLQAKKLTLNAHKSKYSIFKQYSTTINSNDFSLKMCNKTLEWVHSC